jgi:hypothetical protein
MPGLFDRVIVLNLFANTAIFYVAARLYLLPLVACSAATNSRAHSASAFNATSGDDVRDARRNLSRIAIPVCI